MLLTRSPLSIATSFDLHVLGMPPALILSQDQTLNKKFILTPPVMFSFQRSNFLVLLNRALNIILHFKNNYKIDAPFIFS